MKVTSKLILTFLEKIAKHYLRCTLKNVLHKYYIICKEVRDMKIKENKKSSKASTLELLGTGASIISAIIAPLKYLHLNPSSKGKPNTPLLL